MKKIVTIFIFLILANKFIQANQLFDNYKEYTDLEVISNNQIIKFENEYYIGIKIKLAKGWKTYWKNPGDSGATINLDWENKDRYIKSFNILYPTPKRYNEEGLETIGYEKEVIFPVTINLLDYSKKNEFFVNIEYLICKSICIPVQEKRKIIFKPENNKSTNNNLLRDSLAKIPSIKNNAYSITEVIWDSKNSFSLKITPKTDEYIKDLSVFTYSKNYKFEHEVKVINKELILSITSDEDEIIDNKEINVLITNPLSSEEKVVNLERSSFKVSYFKMVILAFMGGIILNFMPCVLPILSLKIYNFIKIRDKNIGRVIKLSGSTIIGITFSFLVLATITIVLRNLGHEIGWGIQFQNQIFLKIFSLILLVFSLNLFGFFDFFLPEKIYKYINFTSKNEYINAFFSGTLATLFATPCSAPFLGTSIGYALTQSSTTIIIIFLSLSIGFSMPYIIILVAPKLVRFLPRPGIWMIYLKLLMALLLLVSSLWFFKLTGAEQIYLSFFGLFIVLAGIFFSKELSKFSKRIFTFFIFFIFVITFYSTKEESSLVWVEYNKTLIDRMILNNEIIFVDITADWCITCQVNKIRTLSSSKMEDIFKEEGIKLVRGDWTNRNSEILAFISSYKKFGIPFNIIYGPSNKRGIILPELLSNNDIIKSIKLVRKKNED